MITIDMANSYRFANLRANQMRTDYVARQKKMAKEEVKRVVDLIAYEKAQSERLTKTCRKY
ncbi:MAG: hypothetical protein DSY90_08050 [Deltaproteobacteria bacterium]|nr:MAG: hypothetical protein DSY90_08050 [Deltaproteobacteria bacterium]